MRSPCGAGRPELTDKDGALAGAEEKVGKDRYSGDVGLVHEARCNKVDCPA